MNICKGKKCFLLIVIFCSGCTSQPSQKIDKCQEYYERHKRERENLERTKDTTSFVEFLNEAIYSNQNCIDIYLTRADMYVNMDSLNLAKKDYTMTLNLYKKNTYALYQLGAIYSLSNKEDSAIYFYKEALATKGYNGVIIDYSKNDKSLSTEVDKYDVLYDEIVYRLGVAYYYKRQLNLALDYFNICIKDKYKVDEILVYRGALYYEAKKKELACKDFLEANKMGNSTAEKYINLYCR